MNTSLRRAGYAGLGVISLALFAALALVARSPVARPRAGPSALPLVRTDDPAALARRVMTALDRTRAAGYGDPSRADPLRWADPACVCVAVDAARLRELVERGVALRDAGAEIADVRVLGVAADRLSLLVTDVLPPYVEVDARGAVVRRWSGRGPQRWRIEIRDGPHGWRLAAVARGP